MQYFSVPFKVSFMLLICKRDKTWPQKYKSCVCLIVSLVRFFSLQEINMLARGFFCLIVFNSCFGQDDVYKILAALERKSK